MTLGHLRALDPIPIPTSLQLSSTVPTVFGAAVTARPNGVSRRGHVASTRSAPSACRTWKRFRSSARRSWGVLQVGNP